MQLHFSTLHFLFSYSASHNLPEKDGEKDEASQLVNKDVSNTRAIKKRYLLCCVLLFDAIFFWIMKEQQGTMATAIQIQTEQNFFYINQVNLVSITTSMEMTKKSVLNTHVNLMCCDDKKLASKLLTHDLA